MSDAWVWDRYWQCDRIASCFDEAGARNYDEKVSLGWRAFFESLPTGARILDLCTGNGAIALIAAELSRARDKGFEIVAVDRAAIDPPTHVSRHADELRLIRFEAGVAIEALPFGDGGFDAVVSQYGVEYSDMDRSLPELARMAAPGARVRLVLHAAEGACAAGSRRVLGEAELLLDEIDLPGAAERCFVAVTDVERGGEASAEQRRLAAEAHREFVAALERTARAAASARDLTMFRNSGGVLLDTYKRRGGLGADQLVAKADAVRTEIRAHRGRLQALVDAAVTAEQADAIARTLRSLGAADARSGPLEREHQLIGHVVEAAFAR